MSMKEQQIQYLKFRKLLNNAITSDDVIHIDFQYNLNKNDLLYDTKKLYGDIILMQESLKSIRKLMR